MHKTPTTAAAIRELLAALSPAFLGLLARASGVPKSTITKIRSGETGNPGIDTVAQIAPHIKGVLAVQRRHLESAPAAMQARTPRGRK